MIYSTTCMYGIHAVCRLAAIAPDGYARVQEICEGSDLPPYFVSKILRDLVRAGLLVSQKGRNGGFGLARAPEKMRLIQIVEVIDGIGPYRQCISGLGRCDDRQPCPQHESFKPIRTAILEYLNGTTVRQMADALTRKAQITGRPMPVIKA
jgi:Rrf2 family protein